MSMLKKLEMAIAGLGLIAGALSSLMSLLSNDKAGFWGYLGTCFFLSVSLLYGFKGNSPSRLVQASVVLFAGIHLMIWTIPDLMGWQTAPLEVLIINCTILVAILASALADLYHVSEEKPKRKRLTTADGANLVIIEEKPKRRGGMNK